ncbi:4-hydroxy-3-methylbut-2-enyl diphosphate reductase [Novosphingobium kunmingense]|uniref:4-hydroxy-3-methylbut-2-enyl diphosphate reductase n=1 Tax=Novosphingobium kunmingense TaxID=1211806 RepID=A0A2N0I4A0_9SPHN|nr:4-hydroxy-3-methylbut-2-enyl diphosphate reductase [Novosphingobium kunmingense]PKB26008.1 4-hydroxy-3-methylbut-2-enyl diphosphate reductase [Novosphingobium kunmingense]
MAARSNSQAEGDKPLNASRRVLLANPRGFCAGVERAIEAVEQALQRAGAPVYVRRAIVHNRLVVEALERRGAVFVQDVAEIPEGAVTVLSAHGSARSVKLAAQGRHLRVIDAICPLVAKVHAEVETWYRAGRHILLIGHAGHPEVVGTLGQVPAGAISVLASPRDLDALDLAPNTSIAYAVQTTFAAREADGLIAAIKARFHDVAGPRSSDICYATTNRQQAIEAIAPLCDLVLVVGDEMSSNARRLVEVARTAGCREARLIAGADALPAEAAGARSIGLTAAASTPETAIAGVCEALRALGFSIEEAPGESERVSFRPVSFEALRESALSGSLDDRLTRLRADIDAEIDRAIGTARGRDRRLAEAMRYAAIGGGKRFRALLVAAVADLVGGSYAQALRVGAAIECIHAQSLVHDDLPCMDDDDLRRGVPTLHRKFDEATAVLAGDALIALAFEILADEATHPDAAVRAGLVLSLARAVGQDGLAGGQMMDLFPPARPSRQDLFDCEQRKTGALIRFAVEAGAMLGHCSTDERARLLTFAENLGLVFQIRDDMLDSIGDAAVVGKAVGKDAGAGRKNAAEMLGLDGAARHASRLESMCHEALDNFGPKASPLRDLARFAVNRMH